MIPQKHLQRLLGISLGTLVLAGVIAFSYLSYLNRRPPRIAQPALASTTEKASQPFEPLKKKMYALFHQDAYYFPMKDARLYLESYYDFPLLFDVDARFARELDQGRISEALRKRFASNRIRLSELAEVSVVQSGSQWVITDPKPSLPWTLKFTIILQDGKLNVYRNPRDFKDYLLQVDFATLYPENYPKGGPDWSPIPWEELRRLYNAYLKNRTPELERLRFRLVAKKRSAP